MKHIPLAIQLYSLREETEKDFTGTLKKAADLGYEGVEFAGYGGLKASELKKVLEDLGLKAAGTHVQLDDLEQDLDNIIAYQKEINNGHIICPFLPEELRKDKASYEDTAKRLNRVGKVCAEHGMTFSYHNHDFELDSKEGEVPLHLLLREEYVNAELDIYWLQKAGEDPLQWMKQYKKKTKLLHLKDMTTDGRQDFAELGTGGIDLEAVMTQGKEGNLDWFIVEQDVSHIGALKSAEVSINYLKENFK
ncbi:sugar phosphate isomerase/epimerase family protein [Alkalicoccus halolimnae]|uniref:Sugar phosphate isomerase/epimerase n=1 Tax=Alkalicoccus halolimnae TaxID=1667239 RepID=A0A5C7FMZ3_9BACI|nr:sugar phosphate isomerase/epimerase [Alkalicoccus halolimnae]TXF86135.1 sugar phosphate isomerase/epimerase [Alkalicoccus halolimnae]